MDIRGYLIIVVESNSKNDCQILGALCENPIKGLLKFWKNNTQAHPCIYSLINQIPLEIEDYEGLKKYYQEL